MFHRRSEWWGPAGLVALSIVPVAAGAMRLAQLARGGTTPENARFFAAPVPIVVHIVSVTLFTVLGAVLFVPARGAPASLRGGRRPTWHRRLGRVVVPAGLVAAASGLWLSYGASLPPPNGSALRAIRLLVGTSMIVALVRGTLAIRHRDVDRHRDWMLRGYALGMGAGTQVFTNLPWVLFVGPPSTTIYAALMGAGWGINVVVAEWMIRRRARSRVVPRMVGIVAERRS